MTVETDPCGWCGKSGSVTIPEEGWKAYQDGVHIQQALYDVNPGQREMLITGTHPECWDDLWADEPEVEEEDDDLPPF